MHIKVDSNLSVERAHDPVHKIEDALIEKLDKNIDLIIHVEPNLTLDNKEKNKI